MSSFNDVIGYEEEKKVLLRVCDVLKSERNRCGKRAVYRRFGERAFEKESVARKRN